MTMADKTKAESLGIELLAARQRQAATAEILKVIASSRSDVQPVFDAITASAERLFEPWQATILMRRGNMLEIAAYTQTASAADRDELKKIFPRPFEPEKLLVARSIAECRVFEVADTEVPPEGYVLVTQSGRAGKYRSAVFVPLVREGQGIGGIAITHATPGSKLDRDQLALLKTFADQAVIAIENARLFNEIKEALERQTATAEILKVIASSPSDVQPVFDAIARSAKLLFGGHTGAVWRVVGETLQIAAYTATDAAGNEALKNYPPIALAGTGLMAKAVASKKPLFDSDVESGKQTGPEGKEVARVRGYRSRLVVPMVREGAVMGVISMTRREAGPFSDHEVNLLSTFADQAVIAIENVRLFNETKEGLEQQTAISEILRVISNSPGDVQPVLDAVAERAARICGAQVSDIVLKEGSSMRVHASMGMLDRPSATVSMPCLRSSVMGRSIVDRAVIHIPDLQHESHEVDFPFGRQLALEYGHRTILTVPLVREDRALGTIVLRRREVRPFDDKHIALLRTFADQAAIAIENVRLFNETKEALEQQTATAGILRVISESPTDTQPVFDAIVESALRLFDGQGVAILLADGDMLQFGSAGGIIDMDAARAKYPRPLDRETVSGRAMVEKQVMNFADAQAPGLPEPMRDVAITLDYHGLTAMPMMRDGEAIGSISVARKAVGGLPEKDLLLLRTFADQAVIAIENVRLFNETKEALERQTATAEILKVIASSPTDVQPVLDTIASSAMQLMQGHSAAVLRLKGDELHFAALTSTDATQDEARRKRPPILLSADKVNGEAVMKGRPVVISDTETDPDISVQLREIARARGFRSILVVPMFLEGSVMGTLTVSRKVPGPFARHEIELLSTFADQAVIAIENVRLFNETKEALEQQTATAEVLQVISNSVSDTAPVFDKILVGCERLFNGSQLIVFLVGNDDTLRIGAIRGPDPERVEAARRLFPRSLAGTATEQCIRERRLVTFADVLNDQGVPEGLRRVAAEFGQTYSVAIAPMLCEGRAIGSILVGRDELRAFNATERRLLETFADQAVIAIENVRLFKELESRTAALEIASHHKSDFLASMSHELRTPLNAILGFNELIVAEIYGPVPEDMKEPLADIQSSGKHLLRLINNVLDLAKIEAGRMELALADYSVHDTVESVRSTLRPLAAEKGLEFITTVPEEIPIAFGDYGRITQCLMNLAGNSLKFTKQGKVEIAVQLKEGVLVYQVNDTGIGIPPDKIGNLFTEFKQTDATIASEYGGTGLGLSISKKFIEMHGGRVWVESEVGKGSSFIFEVPLRTDASRGAES